MAQSELSVPKWNHVLLVCKDCRRRKNGLRHMKPKIMARSLRGVARDSGLRIRIVQSDCLGLCPKGAAAVALVGGSQAQTLAVKTCDAMIDAVTALVTDPGLIVP